MNHCVSAVVLAGSPHGNLGIVRTLGRLGVRVFLVGNQAGAPASRSRFSAGSFRWDFDGAGEADTVDFLVRLGRWIGPQCLLLPTCDHNAVLVARHYQTLAKWFLYPRQAPELAHSLSSKKQMYLLAKKHGVPTPETSFPQSREEVEEFARTASFPVVLKGIDGARLKRSLGAGVIIVNTAADLLAIYAQLDQADHANVMLQEYIPGGDESVWMFNGYFDSNSDCLFGVTGKKIRQYPAYTGATSLGICLANEAVEQTTRWWMKALGYKGILDIGYRYDSRDGRYKVLDVNPRIGATFRLFADRNGMDVARALFLDLAGRPVPRGLLREGRKWMVEDCDLGSMLRYRKDKKLSLLKWVKSLSGIEELAYFSREDLRPFWTMCWNSLRDQLRLGRARSRGSIAQPRFESSQNPLCSLSNLDLYAQSNGQTAGGTFQA